MRGKRTGRSAVSILIILAWLAIPVQPIQDHAAQTAEPSPILAANLAENSQEATAGTRLVVELELGTDPEKVASEVGARLERRGPLNYVTLVIDGEANLDTTLTKLQKLPGVLNAEPARAAQVADGNFSVVNAQGMRDEYYGDQWSLTKIEASPAWDMGAAGDGITIAIIDTGVDLNHPDLQDKLVSGYNAITASTSPGAARDENGHGTHVAGIAAAGMNGTGVTGVAYEAKIMPVKVMDKSGQGQDDIIADGIVWAADHGANIINLSLGSDRQSRILRDAIAYASEKGVLLIAAAGNYDSSEALKEINYPASDPNVLAVTATDKNDVLADFSALGPEAGLAAPGVDILSDWWSSTQGSGYARGDGTSMAAPLVSGAAALVWSEHPTWTASEVSVALKNGTEDLGSLGRDDSFGYGRISAYAEVAFASAPVSYPAPADLPLAGGIVTRSEGNWSASLRIEPDSFLGSQPINIQTVSSPGEFPAGILPAGTAFEITWGEDAPRKMLNLTVKTQVPSSTGEIAGYLYKWSGSRWLQVGGGEPTDTVQAGIYEPGTYRIGYAAVPSATRLAGQDRLATAVAIAERAYPTGADTVILARSDNFPDALAGAPLGYKEQAPILLTEPDGLAPVVKDEIKRLAPQKIILLGGTGAISQAVENELASMAAVERIWGNDRYATAAAIAKKLGTTGKAVVVSGENFPDALAISAEAARRGEPILLTSSGNLPEATAQALRELEVTETTVAGGEGVVSPATFKALPNPLRLAGSDRYATGAAVFKYYHGESASAQLYIATGENFPDALAGGVLAATQGTGILLVPPTGSPAGGSNVLAGWLGKSVIALGGTGVVSPETLKAVGDSLH